MPEELVKGLYQGKPQHASLGSELTILVFETCKFDVSFLPFYHPTESTDNCSGKIDSRSGCIPE